MTLYKHHFSEPVKLARLNKVFPKKMSHVREYIKVQFIYEIATYHNGYRISDTDNVTYDGEHWHIPVISITDDVSEVIEHVLSKWYFGNEARNENVYFYRYLNVFRRMVGEGTWKRVHQRLMDSAHNDLVSNYHQYVEFHRKLDEIDTALNNTILVMKED